MWPYQDCVKSSIGYIGAERVLIGQDPSLIESKTSNLALIWLEPLVKELGSAHSKFKKQLMMQTVHLIIYFSPKEYDVLNNIIGLLKKGLHNHLWYVNSIQIGSLFIPFQTLKA